MYRFDNPVPVVLYFSHQHYEIWHLLCFVTHFEADVMFVWSNLLSAHKCNDPDTNTDAIKDKANGRNPVEVWCVMLGLAAQLKH